MPCDPAAQPVPRILVADDDAEMRSLLVQALRDEGYEVREASDGFQALLGAGLGRTEEIQGVDLIVTDLRMPGLTGTELLAGLRSMGWEMPVVLISAFLDERTAREALRHPAVQVLSKPFSLAALREAVHRAVPTRRPPWQAPNRR